MFDDQLYNVDQWGKFGLIWVFVLFKWMVNIFECGVDLGVCCVVNFVGFVWCDGWLIVNEGFDCYFIEVDKQCLYYNLMFLGGLVSDVCCVIVVYQMMFWQNVVMILFVWVFGGYLKVLFGFWLYLMIQVNKGVGKLMLIKWFECLFVFMMFFGQLLQIEFWLLISISYMSYLVGWEELLVCWQDVIDKVVGLLQENY